MWIFTKIQFSKGLRISSPKKLNYQLWLPTPVKPTVLVIGPVFEAGSTLWNLQLKVNATEAILNVIEPKLPAG